MLLPIATLILAQTAPVPSYRQATDVAIITIEGAVDTITAMSFKRRLEESSNADAIAIELNTPGGDLMSTLEICYEIKNNAPKNTVAWIRPHAFSAGTIIALACREIIVAKGSTFGDAAPINATGQPIPATERAKIESPVLAEVIDSARRNHYDEHLVEAFVSVGIELWLIQNNSTGEVACVNRNEYETLFGKSPPQHFSAIGTEQLESTLLTPFFETISELQSTVQPDDPTWDPVFSQQLPSSRKLFSAKDAADWTLVKQVVPNDRLLTLKPAEGAMYGLVNGVVSTDKELQQWFGATTIQRLKPTWSENMVGVLISWPIRLVLIALFLICVVVEFATGGTGLFGVGAAVSMALLLGAPWLAGLAQWWDIVLVLAGLALIATEVLVIPGTGFTGFTGVAFLFVGMVGSFVSGDLGSSVGQTQLITGLGTVIGGCILAIIGCWIILKQIENTRGMRQLVLQHELGVQTPPSPSSLKVGDEAIAVTDLRPSGKIECDSIIYDATTSGSWITDGTKVRIMQCGMTVEVEEISS
jgi:membrane-bound ClpP family serine protease